MAARLQYFARVMRCPECNSLNESEASACETCGLLLLQTLPKRRADDFAVQKRRSSDQETAICIFCSGEIPGNAIRCRHCGEIVNPDYYRGRASRIRSRLNYISWVAYLFGLAALLVFRPVGLVSIAVGLLLSIAYYAVPVEPPPSRGKRGSFGSFLRRQLKMERVSIALPMLANKKMVFIGTPLIAALVGYSANVVLLQDPVNDILKKNAAFSGMKVSAHYQYWIVPGVVVYDLKSLSVKQTPLDVHTAFLEFAKTLRDKKYSRVEISYQGMTRFSLSGEQFRRVGEEYAKRNFDYVLYKFPKIFRPENAPINKGATDRDALVQFHRAWYGHDVMTKSVADSR